MEERERGGLDYLQREPSIISEVRAPHSRPYDPPWVPIQYQITSTVAHCNIYTSVMLVNLGETPKDWIPLHRMV